MSERNTASLRCPLSVGARQVHGLSKSICTKPRGSAGGVEGSLPGTQRAARPMFPPMLSTRSGDGEAEEEGDPQMWGKARAATNGEDLAALQIPWVFQQPDGAAWTSQRLNLHKDTLRV